MGERRSPAATALRPGVTFHDGTPLTSAVAAEASERAICTAGESRALSLRSRHHLHPTRRRSGAGARAVAAVCILARRLGSAADRRLRELGTGPFRLVRRDADRTGAGAFRSLLPWRARNRANRGSAIRHSENVLDASASRRSGHGHRRASGSRGVHSERRHPGHLVSAQLPVPHRFQLPQPPFRSPAVRRL